METGPQAEVGVEQRFEGNRNGGRGEQQWQEVEDGQGRPVLLPAGGEDAEQQAHGRLDNE